MFEVSKELREVRKTSTFGTIRQGPRRLKSWSEDDANACEREVSSVVKRDAQIGGAAFAVLRTLDLNELTETETKKLSAKSFDNGDRCEARLWILDDFEK